MKTFLAALAIVCLTAPLALAVETVNPSGPIISDNTTMGGVMVQIILGLFLAAAAIGPLVAVLMPPMPESQAHDDHGHDAGGHGH